MPAGKKIALVGHSGSGKSTLVKLLLGLSTPTSWEIRVDGQKLSELSLHSYWKHVAYLTQEPAIFDGSIRDNLSYGMQDIPNDAVLISALKQANADFVFEWEQWLDSMLGEFGRNVSGWERQRLALARVFLRNPSILILDEPTSALDSISEQAITKSLRALHDDITVITIAHRLQTVKDSDLIIVLDHGKIIQQGNHESLLSEDGVYKEMVDLQSGRLRD